MVCLRCTSSTKHHVSHLTHSLNHKSNRKWDKKYIMKHAAAFRRLVTKGRFNFAKTDANYKVLIISNKYNVK